MAAGYPTIGRDGVRWAVTAAFYCAVHGMTAYLIGRGVTVESHDERRWALADPRNGVPRDVYRAYGRLQGRSVGARYMLQVFTPAQVRQLLDRELATVTRFVGLCTPSKGRIVTAAH